MEDLKPTQHEQGVIDCYNEIADVWKRYNKKFGVQVPLKATSLMIAGQSYAQPEPKIAIEAVIDYLREAFEKVEKHVAVSPL